MMPTKRPRYDSVQGRPASSHGRRLVSSSTAASTPTHGPIAQGIPRWQGTQRSDHRPSSSQLDTINIVPTLDHHQRPLSPEMTVQDRDEHDEDVDEDDADDEWSNQVIMSIEANAKGDVGCCYYVARDQKLLLMSDVTNGGLEILDALKTQVQPTVVILSQRVSEGIELCFDPKETNDQAGDNEYGTLQLPYVLEYRPMTEFAYDSGKKRLVSLDLSSHNCRAASFLIPGENELFDEITDGCVLGFTEKQGKLLKVSAGIDMQSRLTVGCAGAVLAYVGRHRLGDILPGDVESKPSSGVKSVQMFNLNDIVFVNSDTLASLQIIHTEASPNAHSQGPSKGVSGSKEGLSVYGLFHRLARTPQGKRLLKQYFLRPTLDEDVINERLESVSVFLRPDNEGPVKIITKNLGQIKNMNTVMVYLRKGMSNTSSKGGIRSSVWSSLRLFAFHSLQIRDALLEVIGAERRQVRQKIFIDFDTHLLAHVGRRVSEIVDFRGSAEMHRTVVNPGINEELDTMKRNYNGMEDMLNLTSRAVAATIPLQYCVKVNVIFFPQIGFLITVPNDPETGAATFEGSTDEGHVWDPIFSTAIGSYFKDFRMRELDETWGDVYASICEREIEIIHELAQEILQYEGMLNNASDMCGELDSILALSQGARMYKLCRPRISTDNVIDIRGGRHLLQELNVSFVPNDTYVKGGAGTRSPITARTLEGESTSDTSPGQVSEDFRKGPSMLMMTGPNYSGKSVYLKQIALIVYMAHVGSFVPADRARIGLTDKILTRIATRNTVSRFQSAFMIDLQQATLAIKLATRRSLVVIDEFGKGTDSSDGAGLACGVFEHFLRLGENRPKVLGATHFHELFENGFLRSRPSLAFAYMEVRIDADQKEAEDQITYLYNLRSGRSNSSYGSYCAAINGVDAAVIERSRELEVLSARCEDLVAACAEITVEEEEDLKAAEVIARDFLAQDLHLLAQPERLELRSPQPRLVLENSL